MSRRYYVTTAIPFVNGAPHVGHALEMIQVDALARHRRQCGDEVRFLSGTDDNALKNVQAAEQAGVPVADFVERNARYFSDQRDVLHASFDDFIRTSSDPRHRAAVERLWRQNAESGDLYRKHYEGLYCVGCEQFYKPDELDHGKCPEHLTEPAQVAEDNWFFKLSRYQDQVHGLIERDELIVRPDEKRNEVLRFIEAGLEDFSVSRTAERAHGWGVPVPDDASQIVYVWYDALGNYISALDYGTDGDAYRHWWLDNPNRVHVIGKGIVRFHAIYWPAILLSAGQPLPQKILVHDYLTVEGQKIGKSLGNTADPLELSKRYGADALRWWMLREVPRVGDADFSVAKLIARANQDLANDLGNLVNRTIAMCLRYRDGEVTERGSDPQAAALREAVEAAPARVEAAMEAFDFRAALDAIWAGVSLANRYVDQRRPWDLAKAEKESPEKTAELDAALGTLVWAEREISVQLQPFIPKIAAEMASLLAPQKLEKAEPLFPRIETDDA